MKLWEVLKALDENPKKVFECDTGSRIKFFDNKLYWYDKHNNPKEAFEIRDKRSRPGVCHNTGDFWQEIIQPVTWQEAIEAWANGKTVKCVDDEGKAWTYKQKWLVASEDDNALALNEIKYGTWYIED